MNNLIPKFGRAISFTALLLTILLIASCRKYCFVEPRGHHFPPPPPPPPTDSCVISLTEGLIGYYPFTGNFNDQSGGNNNAAPMNGAFLTSDKNGNPNAAAGFDGIDDYLIVQDNGSMNSDSGSVSFWFNLNVITDRYALVNRIRFEDATALEWSINKPYAGDDRLSFSVANPVEDCSLMPANDPSITLFSDSGISADTWYQVTCTFAGGVEKMYINGILHGTKMQPFTSFKKCNSTNLLIGGWWNQDMISMNGKIDDVRIYNRILRPCEINKLAVDIP